MEDAIKVAMFEFAQNIQSLIKYGYEIGKVNYDRQYGSSMEVIKDGQTALLYSACDIDTILRCEYEKKHAN